MSLQESTLLFIKLFEAQDVIYYSDCGLVSGVVPISEYTRGRMIFKGLARETCPVTTKIIYARRRSF